MVRQAAMEPGWPTGMVTFLFTDIEGSTTLWEEHSDAMQLALACHDKLLRDAIEATGGLIVKTMGDGVHAVFADPVSALAACLSVQRELQRSRALAPSTQEAAADSASAFALRVRMGLHTGTADLRNRDYFGATLNRAARIMSVAHGEQILLSATTAEMLSGDLPAGVALRELGEHRLKGLLKPERLLQVVASDLRADFPPLASLTGHNLPVERDAFVGRREALAELAQRLDAGARLISVLGVGGAGKTRLVIRFGWRSIGLFPGGVWFCDLSDARSVGGIVQAVAHGFDVPLANDDPVNQLAQSIARREKCLVILDNFEQVVRHAPQTLGRWLNVAREARFVVTTREVLGLQGEESLTLPPLTPAAAAALFASRAAAANPEFALGDDDQAAIEPLVKLLEGLPLAIELAAARVRVMHPRTLLQRMSERFKLLASTGGRIDRQATLRAVFDWSWDLLTLPEKAAFAQLSVFEGGFTLEAAEAVLDIAAYEGAPWPVDALQSLVKKSLVRQASYERFDLLVSAKEYAAEHLRTETRYVGSGAEAKGAAEARHGVYFAGLDEATATSDGCADLENLIVACRRAAARGDADVAAKALVLAWAGLGLRGPYGVGADLAAMVRATLVPGEPSGAAVIWVAGRALMAQGKYAEAYVQFEAALARAREAGDRLFECRALFGLGTCDARVGRNESAQANLESAFAAARDANDRGTQIEALTSLGNLAAMRGWMSDARLRFETGVAMAQESGDRKSEGHLRNNLGMLCVDTGAIDNARPHLEAALAAAQETGDRRLEGIALCNLGFVNRIQERFEEAIARLEPSLAIAHDAGHAYLEWQVLLNLGVACDRVGRSTEAEQHLDASLSVVRQLADRRAEAECLGELGLFHALNGRPGQARPFLDSAEDLSRAAQDRMTLGMTLCLRAEAEFLAGTAGAGTAALAEAEAIAVELEADPDSNLRRAIAHARGVAVQAQHGELERR